MQDVHVIHKIERLGQSL